VYVAFILLFAGSLKAGTNMSCTFKTITNSTTSIYENVEK
jgi:hypothetical protein